MNASVSRLYLGDAAHLHIVGVVGDWVLVVVGQHILEVEGQIQCWKQVAHVVGLILKLNKREGEILVCRGLLVLVWVGLIEVSTVRRLKVEGLRDLFVKISILEKGTI